MEKTLLFLILFLSSAHCFCQQNQLMKSKDTIFIPISKADLPAYLSRLSVRVDDTKPKTTDTTPKNIPPPQPTGNVYPPTFANQSANLSVKISLPQSSFSNIDDIKINIVVTNTSYRPQTFIFDRPAKASNGIWACRCILNYEKGPITHFPYSITPEAKAYTEKDLEKYYYTLQPGEWIMKIYSLKSLVTFNESLFVKGKLPKGKYTVQLSIQNNPSNTLSFVMR